MAIAAVITQASQFGGTGGTTAAINTTGANLIVVGLTYRQNGGANLSDSKGNTWTQLTKYEGSGAQSGVVFYYCASPTVGSGHTFTTTSIFCGLCVGAFSGARTSSPSDQQNGQFVVTLGTTLTPGSIAPSVNNCVVLTTCMNFNGTAPIVPTGYTSIGTWPTSTAFAGGCAYKIQTTASTENPSWGNMNAGSNGAANIASFFPPAIVNNNSGFFMFF
jgi:hypothetical protein